MGARGYRAAVVGAALLGTVTCDSLDNITVDASGETTIPMRSILDEVLGGLAFLGFEGFDISESQEFRNQGYSKDQIDSVRVQSFVLEITAPDGATFDFLERISFSVEAGALPPVEIARIDPIPAGQSRLELEILDAELRDYAVEDSMTITTSATGVRPEQETDVSAVVELNVDVDVGGALGCSAAGRRVAVRLGHP